MADLVPHPLVTRFGLDLARKGVGTFAEVLASLQEQFASEDAVDTVAATVEQDDKCVKEKEALAKALADQADLPELSLFAGYLGGPVEHDGKEYRLLYLDSRLEKWMLVLAEDIVVFERLKEEKAASGKRDVLWVRSTATLIQGTGTRAAQGRFLVGDFTRAGDYAASTTGGTFSAATGLLCEATTPGCCWTSRTR